MAKNLFRMRISLVKHDLYFPKNGEPVQYRKYRILSFPRGLLDDAPTLGYFRIGLDEAGDFVLTLRRVDERKETSEWLRIMEQF